MSVRFRGQVSSCGYANLLYDNLVTINMHKLGRFTFGMIVSRVKTYLSSTYYFLVRTAKQGSELEETACLELRSKSHNLDWVVRRQVGLDIVQRTCLADRRLHYWN